MKKDKTTIDHLMDLSDITNQVLLNRTNTNKKGNVGKGSHVNPLKDNIKGSNTNNNNKPTNKDKNNDKLKDKSKNKDKNVNKNVNDRKDKLNGNKPKNTNQKDKVNDDNIKKAAEAPDLTPVDKGPVSEPKSVSKPTDTKKFTRDLVKTKLADLNKVILDSNYLKQINTLDAIIVPFTNMAKNLNTKMKDMAVRTSDDRTIKVTDALADLTKLLDQSLKTNSIEFIASLLHQYERYTFVKPLPNVEIGMELAEQLDQLSNDSTSVDIVNKPHSRLDGRKEPSTIRHLYVNDLIITKRTADYINKTFGVTEDDDKIQPTNVVYTMSEISKSKISYNAYNISEAIESYNDKAWYVKGQESIHEHFMNFVAKWRNYINVVNNDSYVKNATPANILRLFKYCEYNAIYRELLSNAIKLPNVLKDIVTWQNQNMMSLDLPLLISNLMLSSDNDFRSNIKELTREFEIVTTEFLSKYYNGCFDAISNEFTSIRKLYSGNQEFERSYFHLILPVMRLSMRHSDFNELTFEKFIYGKEVSGKLSNVKINTLPLLFIHVNIVQSIMDDPDESGNLTDDKLVTGSGILTGVSPYKYLTNLDKQIIINRVTGDVKSGLFPDMKFNPRTCVRGYYTMYMSDLAYLLITVAFAFRSNLAKHVIPYNYVMHNSIGSILTGEKFDGGLFPFFVSVKGISTTSPKESMWIDTFKRLEHYNVNMDGKKLLYYYKNLTPIVYDKDNDSNFLHVSVVNRAGQSIGRNDLLNAIKKNGSSLLKRKNLANSTWVQYAISDKKVLDNGSNLTDLSFIFLNFWDNKRFSKDDIVKHFNNYLNSFRLIYGEEMSEIPKFDLRLKQLMDRIRPELLVDIIIIDKSISRTFGILYDQEDSWEHDKDVNGNFYNNSRIEISMSTSSQRSFYDNKDENVIKVAVEHITESLTKDINVLDENIKDRFGKGIKGVGELHGKK